MKTRTTKLDPSRIRDDSIRNTARRRGLTLMQRRGSWWIIRDGEIVAGGARGLTIDQIEHLIRREGFGRKPRAMAS